MTTITRRTFTAATTSLMASASPVRKLELRLQTRDAADRLVITTETVDPGRIGIVAIDTWDWHWCMTATQRVGALVPRMNAAVEGARRLGMPIFWAPTDVADYHAAMPQRQRAIAVPRVAVPKFKALPNCFRFKVVEGVCLCGPGIPCEGRFDWEGMNPGLVVAPGDYITKGIEELYSLSKQKGLTHLIYIGVHTNICVFSRAEGLRNLAPLGFRCMLARDLHDAQTKYDPKTGFTPDQGTAGIAADMESAGIPTINLGDQMREAGVWDERQIADTVRITPWGTKARPYLFASPFAVTLTAPWLDGAQIRYTLDAQDPHAGSELYRNPLEVAQETSVRAAAFRNGRRVSLVAGGYFARLAPMPPKPQVHLDDLLQPLSPGDARAMRIGQAYSGGPLTMRERQYSHGIGVCAPAHIVLPLKPEYQRFVALVGIDDDVQRKHEHAYYQGVHSCVQFRVFIDGNLAAESPVMHLLQEPWRFDVKIPAASWVIALVASGAAGRSLYDVGNWADAGFLREG